MVECILYHKIKGELFFMDKKVFKSISLSLIVLLILGFTFFFVGCKNKANNAPYADSIPDSNVYEDLVEYVKTNKQLELDGNYAYFIVGDQTNTSTKFIALLYSPAQDLLALFAVDKAIGGCRLIIPKATDYSKGAYRMTIGYFSESEAVNKNIFLLTKKFIDMNTTTKLTDIALFNETEPLTEEQKQILTHLSPLVSEGLTEFSNFYANTIKKDNRYLGATYKYFYLPVIK